MSTRKSGSKKISVVKQPNNVPSFVFSCLDILLEINKHLSNKDTLSLLSVNKFFEKNKKQFFLYEKVPCSKIDETKWYFEQLRFFHFLKTGRIPSKAKALMIVVNKKGKLPKIPETVVDLYISFLFSARKVRSSTLVPGYIPRSVKRLIIHGYAPENRTLDIGVIPKGVEVLGIDCDGFRDLKILPGSIPDTVKEIKFGDQIVLSGEDGIIPSSAQKLYFDHFLILETKRIQDVKIPETVKEIYLRDIENFNKLPKKCKITKNKGSFKKQFFEHKI